MIYRPVIKIGENGKWNKTKEVAALDLQDNKEQTAMFPINIDFDNNEHFLEIAFCFPYSHKEMLKDIADIKSSYDNNSSIFFHHEVLSKSPEGLDIPIMTITSHDLKSEGCETYPVQEGQSTCKKFETRKPVIILSSRVHPGETPCSHALNGCIKKLLNLNDRDSILLRKIFVFKIIPSLNPDGVFHGHFRKDRYLQNLNRFYKKPNQQKQPSCYALKILMDYYTDPHRVMIYTDFHAHSSTRNCFVYGNHCTFVRQVEARQLTMVLSELAPAFSYEDCEFSAYQMKIKERGDEMGKEGCARVMGYLLGGLAHSYTLEMSYHSVVEQDTKLEIKPLELEDMEDVGESFLVSILHIFNLKKKANINQNNEILSHALMDLKGMREKIAISIKKLFQQDENKLDMKCKNIHNLVEEKYYSKLFFEQMDYIKIALANITQNNFNHQKKLLEKEKEKESKEQALIRSNSKENPGLEIMLDGQINNSSMLGNYSQGQICKDYKKIRDKAIQYRYKLKELDNNEHEKSNEEGSMKGRLSNNQDIEQTYFINGNPQQLDNCVFIDEELDTKQHDNSVPRTNRFVDSIKRGFIRKSSNSNNIVTGENALIKQNNTIFPANGLINEQFHQNVASDLIIINNMDMQSEKLNKLKEIKDSIKNVRNLTISQLTKKNVPNDNTFHHYQNTNTNNISIEDSQTVNYIRELIKYNKELEFDTKTKEYKKIKKNNTLQDCGISDNKLKDEISLTNRQKHQIEEICDEFNMDMEQVHSILGQNNQAVQHNSESRLRKSESIILNNEHQNSSNWDKYKVIPLLPEPQLGGAIIVQGINSNGQFKKDYYGLQNLNNQRKNFSSNDDHGYPNGANSKPQKPSKDISIVLQAKDNAMLRTSQEPLKDEFNSHFVLKKGFMANPNRKTMNQSYNYNKLNQKLNPPNYPPNYNPNSNMNNKQLNNLVSF